MVLLCICVSIIASLCHCWRNMTRRAAMLHNLWQLKFLLLISLFYKVYSTFNLREHFHTNTINAAPKLFDHLDHYISMHSSDVVLNETSICHRDYAVATYACPQAIGNHMHEFLNAFAGAFITNRTLLWRFCGRKPCLLDNEGDCNEFTQRFPWMMSLHDFEKRWKSDNCSAIRDGNEGHVHQLVPQKFRFQTEQILICCALDIFPKIPVIDYGTFELHEFYALSVPIAADRLQNFSNSKAKELFQHGEDFGYGVLFRSTFKIRTVVTVPNDITIERNMESLNAVHNPAKDSSIVVKPTYIGLHIRHSNNNKEEDMDVYGYNCAKDMLAIMREATKHNTTEVVDGQTKTVVRPCVILLASDRKHEIDKWINVTHHYAMGGQLANCSILTSNHTHAHVAWNEHGPFSGEIAMQDLDLLSRSDIFIGSSYAIPMMMNIVSTFSMLMAELRATNGKEHSLTVKSRFLPHCGNVVGARHQPHEVYNGVDYKCGDSKHIMLPIECAYWNKTSLN